MSEDKAQRNFTDPESRIMPAPEGRDFIQGYNCQAVVDPRSSGDRGGLALPTGPRIRVRPWVLFRKPRSIPAPCPGKSPPTRATTRPRQLTASMPWGWTPSSLRVGLATERQSRPPPGPHARQSVNQGPDAAEAEDETGPTALRAADGDGGARVRAGQTGPRLPAVLTEGPGKGEPGVVDDLHRAQPAQAVPVWAPGPGMNQGHRPGRARWVSTYQLKAACHSMSIGETPSTTGRNS